MATTPTQPPFTGAPPEGWPPRTRRRRRGALAGVITFFGVLGAVVLAVGVTVLVMGRITHVAPAPSAAGTQAAQAPAPAGAGELRARLQEAHPGIAVDFGAARAEGTALEAGQPVREAPGVLLVESLIGRSMGAGTGIVLSADGLAITNYHVVEDSSKVFVTVADTGERRTATVLGRDAEHDIAVLDVDDVTDLPVASLAAEDVTRGDAVAAIGNARGQGHLTAVRGTVLGRERSIMAASEGSDEYSRLTGLVQTDADVVPGYSGGPLVDGRGQVVAVTVAASDGVTGDEVDGFAIPVDVALGVVEQVLSGVETDTVSIGTDGALGIVVASGSGGVQVMEVSQGSPAERIGLAPGDLIVEIEGTQVDGSAAHMSRLVNDHNVGDRIHVSWRTPAGERREAEAELQAALVH